MRLRKQHEPTGFVQVIEVTALLPDGVDDPEAVELTVTDPVGAVTTLAAVRDEPGFWTVDVRSLAILLPLDGWSFTVAPVEPDLTVFTFNTDERFGMDREGHGFKL